MSGYSVIYFDHNFIDKRYLNSPQDGDSFYTYGFGGLYSREFKKYNPDIPVECWKTDSRIHKIYEKEISGVFFRIFPAKKIKYSGDFSFSLIRNLKKVKNEKIILNMSSINHLLFYTVAWNSKNIPLIVQGHGETTALFNFKKRKLISKLKAIPEMVLQYFAFKNIDIYYTLDTKIKDYFPKTVNKNKILKQTTGVDPDLFPALSKKEARQILSLDPNNKYLLYVGKLNRTKRPDILINVFLRLKEKYSNLELIIAGNNFEDPFYPLAKKAGAKIYGVVLQTELYKYLSAADVYVLAKLDDIYTFGGVGMLPIQALLCNTPIVGETVKNIPSEIRDKVGIMADSESTIYNSLDSILNRSKKYENLRELATHYYSWYNISLATRSNYDLLIRKKWKIS